MRWLISAEKRTENDIFDELAPSNANLGMQSTLHEEVFQINHEIYKGVVVCDNILWSLIDRNSKHSAEE
jgi:hypothetical protein